MQIEIRNYRRIARADIDASGIALVCGRNGAGKTSVIQAIQAALTGTAVTIPGGTIKGASALVHRGEAEGHVKIRIGDLSATIQWPRCKVYDAAAPKASASAVGLTSILDAKQADRAKYLAPYIAADVPREDVAAAMKDAGYSDATVEKLWNSLGADGWDKTHKSASEFGTKLKGQWEAITKEAWGAKKAEEWRPGGWTDDLDGADHATLQEIAAAAESDIIEKHRAGAVSEAEIAALREAASAAEHVDVDARREALAEATAALERLQAERDALPPAGDDSLPCPHCGGALVVDVRQPARPALLAAESRLSAREIKDRRLAVAEADGKISRARTDEQAARNALATAERIFDDGQRAATRLEAIGAAGDGGEAIEEARIARDVAVARLRLFEARAEAARIHANWARNDRLVEALAPDGMRKRAMLRGLGALNDHLNAACTAAGWAPVRLDENLEAHFGNEPYWLAAASEQWRVRVTLQVALAKLEGACCVVIDAADILDARGRNHLVQLLRWAALPAAVVAMTVNKPELVPDLAAAGFGTSYWLDQGVARPVGAGAQERAA